MSDQKQIWSDTYTSLLGHHCINLSWVIFLPTVSSYIMIGHYVRPNWKMLGQTPILVGKCPMSDRYFKHWTWKQENLTAFGPIVNVESYIWDGLNFTLRDALAKIQHQKYLFGLQPIHLCKFQYKVFSTISLFVDIFVSNDRLWSYRNAKRYDRYTFDQWYKTMKSSTFNIHVMTQDEMKGFESTHFAISKRPSKVGRSPSIYNRLEFLF